MRSTVARPSNIDEYLANVGEDKRAALEKLRQTIRAAAPRAEECISYQLAAFRLNGKLLVAFGATANHCAFYPMSSHTVEAHREELKDYETSKGTIRFQADKPLPTALVRKLVKARIAENEWASGPPSMKPAPKKRAAKPQADGSQADPAVIAFLTKLKPPLKSEMEAVRQIILGAHPEIREGIKWNAPSFRTTEYFATLNNPRAKDHAMLILHAGAKKRNLMLKGLVADPAGLLTWLAGDRCLVKFDGVKDIHSKRGALAAIIREWLRHI